MNKKTNKFAKNSLRRVSGKNPQVSVSVVEQHDKLARKLEKAGVQIRKGAHYTLSPPFGEAVNLSAKK